jgi:hypothetical protein
VAVVTPAASGPGAHAPAAMLVRPDGYVAWASDEQDAARRAAALGTALTRWCGAPTGQPAAERTPAR